MPTTYAKPTTVRLDDQELEIVQRIREELSRPGVSISQSDAIGVALHEWDEQHPPKKVSPNASMVG